MDINIPKVKAEVEAAFTEYEKALVSNNVEVLDELFLKSPTTIRYGGGENLYGYDEIAAFRSSRSNLGLERSLENTVITTFGTSFATASTLFYRDKTPGKVGRQMQTWVRMSEGWRVVAAHVSVIDAEDA
ncbi:oxalurate catabolism protein HpxZ [Roseibium algae]|uniref:Oxalurate catabolism protein HpxZ n=1 Tax=Roseibium algae TaxID=3123038 RepID=A0ABU8TEF3_9HYPH